MGTRVIELVLLAGGVDGLLGAAAVDGVYAG
jgi:hypothetical protein